MKNKQYKLLFLVTISCLLFFMTFLSGCKKNTTSTTANNVNTIIAKKQELTTDLYFKSKIFPYNVIPVVSPEEGVIKKKFFDYGDIVHKNAQLFEVDSAKLQQDFNSALTNFLKAKQDVIKSQTNFAGTQALWEHKLISEQEYSSDKDSFALARLNYIQSRLKLREFHNNLFANVDLEKMSLEDFGQLEKLLAKTVVAIFVKSPIDGLILVSDTSSDDSSSSDSAKKVNVGDAVKKGQLLVSIGDLTGISLQVSASEIHINDIKVGDKVTVTGPAFPDRVLDGEITFVGTQSKSSGYGEGTLAEFPIKIAVKDIPLEQRKLIHIGMTADIKLTLKNKPEIVVPINAVRSEAGKSVVDIIDPKTNLKKTVEVKTGQTTFEGVAITDGLQEGDKVVVPLM